MPEQDARTRELQHPEEVGDVVLPARHEPTRVVEPGEEPFDLPAPSATAEGPPILGRRAAPAVTMRGDHLDVVAFPEQRVERITVVSAVADQSRGEVGEEASVEGRGDEVRLIRRSAGHVHGERKTMAVADRHDLAPFTTAGRAHGSAPFFAPA